MSPKIPLGARESEILEFKSRDALKNLATIAREVVAMLNSKRGGDVWVGLREDGGLAIELEEIRDPHAERTRLRNHLIDTIEPSPMDDEIEIEVVPDDRGRSVLHLHARGDPRIKPYAQLREKEKGRFFFVRVGDRVRSMSREEIVSAIRGQSLDGAKGKGASARSSEAAQAVRAARDQLQKAHWAGMWLRLEPDSELDVPIGDDWIGQLLTDPTASGNRAEGWVFANRFDAPRLEEGKRVLGDETSQRTVIHRDGWIEYRAPLEWLRHGGEHSEIYPLALIERTTSIFRLARTLYTESAEPLQADAGGSRSRHRQGSVVREGPVDSHAHDFHVVADFALMEAQGWKLRPYSPRTFGYQLRHEEKELETRDLLLGRPLVFRAREITTEPDRCALRLLTRVYEVFGYSPDKLPGEFDQVTGRLVLPS